MGRSRRRKIFRYSLVALLLLAVLVAVAPWLVNIGPVRRYVEGRIGGVLGRSVQLGTLEAGWGSGVLLRDLVVANQHREFRDDALMEVERVHLDEPLLGLIFGGGEGKVKVDGLVLRVEEHGGRTNLDDLVERMTVPPGVPPPEPVKPRPLDIEMKNCTIELRRTPPRPRGVDPFREDPVILASDAHATTFALDRVDVGLVMDGPAVRLRFAGGVSVNGKGGSVRGELRLARDEVSGKVSAREVDLSVLEPLLHWELGGLLDFEARGGSEGFEIKATVVRLESGMLDVSEEWVEVEARMSRAPELWKVDRLAVTTASGEISVVGRGTIGETIRFGIEGRVPRRLVPRAKGEGRIGFDWTGSLAGRRVTLKGTTTLDELVAVSDVSFDFDTKALEIGGLAAKADQVDLFLSGRATLDAPMTCDVTGRADADLAALKKLLEPYVAVDRRIEVEGHAAFGDLRLVWDANRNATLRADGKLTNLRLAGLLDEEIVEPEALVSVDATLSEDGNVLTVRSGRLHELNLEGRVVGLREERIREASGSIKGALVLPPMAGRMLQVDDLRGRAILDITARTDATGLGVSGTATVEELRTAGIERKRVVVAGEATRARGKWSGSGRIVSDGLAAEVKLHEFSGATLRGTATLERTALRALLEALPDFELPAQLELGGEVAPSCRCERLGDVWSFRVVVPQTRLTALWKGQGIRDEPVGFAGTVSRAGEDWRLEQAAASVAGLQLFPTAVMARDGAVAGSVRLKGRAAQLVAFHPELARRKPTGLIEAAVDFRIDEEGVAVNGTLTGDQVALTLDGKRMRWDRFTLSYDGDGQGRVRRFVFKTGATSVQGSGRVGETLNLALAGDGDFADLAPLLRDVTGSGAFRLRDATLLMPRPGGAGPFKLVGRFGVKRLGTSGVDLRNFQTEFEVTGRTARGDLWDLAGTLRARADRAMGEDLTLTGLRLDVIGNGELLENGGGKGFRFRSDLAFGKVVVDTLPLEEVEAKVRGVLFDFSIAKAALRGRVGFARAKSKSITWTDGGGAMVLRQGLLEIQDLVATANEGKVSGSGQVDFNQDPLRWQADLTVDRVRLTEELGNPLARLIPILHLDPGKNKKDLTGVISARLTLSGAGTTMETLEDTMAGRGSVHFHEAEITGSLLLPLLSLRLDQALLRKPYRFGDVDVLFSVSDRRVNTQPFELRGTSFQLHFSGSAGLNGNLDFLMRTNLLRIPFRIRGTLDDPSVKLSPRDLFR